MITILPGNMTAERYTSLQRSPDVGLTVEERKAGWHYCNDWDGRLIHKTDPEFACCSCKLGVYT